MREQIRHIAATHAAVLIEGEAGTGKRLAALAIHDESPRAERPFVAVDCGALGSELIERALFGEGPVGGAAPVAGRLEQAAGGTLYLEEVGAAPPPVQIRLLRVLQEREFEPPDGGPLRRIDVRLIAATRDDLAAAADAGRFRPDLLVRLGVVRMAMPLLRERREDVPLLVAAFLRAANRTHRRRVTGVTPGVLDRLMAHGWPGNVRELEAAVEGMVALASGRRPLDVADLPAALRGPENGRDLEIAVGMTVDQAERRLIEATLRHAGDDKRRAAAMLGIGLRTLYRKMATRGAARRGPRRRRRGGRG